MTQEEFILSLVATAVGSPLLLEGLKAFIGWRRGRLSKIAALEAALAEAKEALEALERHKQTLREEHRQEVDTLLRQQRELELHIHRLRVRLINLGKDPDQDD